MQDLHNEFVDHTFKTPHRDSQVSTILRPPQVENMHRNANEPTLSQVKYYLAQPASSPNDQVDLSYHQMYLTMMLNSHHQVKVRYITFCRSDMLTRCHEHTTPAEITTPLDTNDEDGETGIEGDAEAKYNEIQQEQRSDMKVCYKFNLCIIKLNQIKHHKHAHCGRDPRTKDI